MAFDGKYSFDNVNIGTEGWNDILQGNMEKVEDNLYSNALGTYGETIAQYEALYLSSDGKYYRARAISGKLPCIGIALEAGVLDDSIKILQLGEVTNGAWAWTVGGVLYLSSSSYGTLTQTSGTQIVGYAKSATQIFFNPDFTQLTATVSTTTTTTTTTSSSTTTTTTV